MSVLDARKDSNAAKGGADTGPTDKGGAEILGFTKVEYPDDLEPVQSNFDVKSSHDNIASKAMGDNLGTSRGSYKFQPENPSAEEGWGKTKESATGVFAGK
jgi:hypothetical protein